METSTTQKEILLNNPLALIKEYYTNIAIQNKENTTTVIVIIDLFAIIVC